MKVSVLMAAAGSGSRLQKSSKTKFIPKVLLSLDGHAMLEYSLKTLSDLPEVKEIIIAAHPRHQKMYKDFLKSLTISKPVKVVAGGATRAESVGRALRASNHAFGYVMVHDAARPFVSTSDLKKLIQTMQKNSCDGVVLGQRTVATLKRTNERDQAILETVDRSYLWEAQTPQLFLKSTLEEAYQKWNQFHFEATDDASLLEHLGGCVKMVEAQNLNTKITTLSDLELSEKICRGSRLQKVGIGDDIHRLVEKRKLKIGGVNIPFHKGALGHSDGDSLLHAITDALLGASGEGDIGEHFPDTKKSLRGIDSRKILKSVWEKLEKKSFELIHLDATVFIQKPKIAPFKTKIKNEIARVLNVKSERINLKAKTMEGLGLIGNEEAVAARAVVVLYQRGAL